MAVTRATAATLDRPGHFTSGLATSLPADLRRCIHRPRDDRRSTRPRREQRDCRSRQRTTSATDTNTVDTVGRPRRSRKSGSRPHGPDLAGANLTTRSPSPTTARPTTPALPSPTPGPGRASTSFRERRAASTAAGIVTCIGGALADGASRPSPSTHHELELRQRRRSWRTPPRSQAASRPIANTANNSET